MTDSDPNRPSDSPAAETPVASTPAPAGEPAAGTASRGDAAPAPASKQSGRGGLVVGAIAIVLALVALAWSMQRFERIESEVARRLQSAEQRATALEAELAQSGNLVRDLQNRSAVLESKVAETAGLQAQLEKLYRDRAEDSYEVLLAETEASLALAVQQLALGADVQAVLAALQDLEARMARQNEPRLVPVRAALVRDIERLRVFPASDVGAVAIRIDALLSALDQLPLLATIREPVETANGVVAGGSTDAGAAGAAKGGPASVEATARDRLNATLGAFGNELRDLFRVRRIDAPEAMLVSPTQAYFLRQNLRLMLLNARVALLSRNDTVFRGDLERARRWIDTYYDGEHRNVLAVQGQLRQLLDAKLMLAAPRIDESIAAVRLARAALR